MLEIGFQNEMLIFTFLQIGFVILIAFVFSPLIAGIYMGIALISILLLETINYVEHYGLRRKKNANGRYETVQVWHSWNSNHELGRIFLYEVTRHSDHHYKAERKYQVLRHFDESPQLPFGYPGSMILAWCPPLWFKVMDKEVEKFNKMPIVMA